MQKFYRTRHAVVQTQDVLDSRMTVGLIYYFLIYQLSFSKVVCIFFSCRSQKGLNIFHQIYNQLNVEHQSHVNLGFAFGDAHKIP